MTAGPRFLLAVLLVLLASLGAPDRSRSRYRPPGWREVATAPQSLTHQQQEEVQAPEPTSNKQQPVPRTRYRDPPRRTSISEPAPRTILRDPIRPRTRLTTPAPRRQYNNYDYDYTYDYDYQPAVQKTTKRPRVLSRGRAVNRVTTRPPYAPRGSYDYYDDYSDYRSEPRAVAGSGRTRLTTVSPFQLGGGRGRAVDAAPGNIVISPERRREETERRNRLFLQNKERYCSPNEFLEDKFSEDDTSEDPSLITVTHVLSGLLAGLGATSEELVPLGLLRSTQVSASPLIYYSASTALGSIVYSGLVAGAVEEVVVRPTCILGRSTLVSRVTTTNQYSVQPVTQQLQQLGQPDEPDLTQLLLSLLAQDSAPDSTPPPILPSLSTSLVTSLSTLSSTYITTLTESDTTLISLTFRGKEVVSTIISTSTHEVTATEFSTATIVTTSLVNLTPGPAVPATLASLPASQEATPPLDTYLVTRTSTNLQTSTEQITTILPINFRGKLISTTLTSDHLVTLTQTTLHTETMTRAPAPAPLAPASPDLLALEPLLQDLGLSYTDLDLDLVSLLLGPPAPQLPALQQAGDPWDGLVLSGKNF